jgi:hypothetical protein
MWNGRITLMSGGFQPDPYSAPTCLKWLETRFRTWSLAQSATVFASSVPLRFLRLSRDFDSGGGRKPFAGRYTMRHVFQKYSDAKTAQIAESFS